MGSDTNWENKATKPVLQFLAETGLAFSNSGLIYNLQHWDRWSQLEEPPSEATINRALRGLRERGLVDRPRGNLYKINEEGLQYLAERFGVDEGGTVEASKDG